MFGAGFPDVEPPEWYRHEELKDFMRQGGSRIFVPVEVATSVRTKITSTTTEDRSDNALRPTTFDDIVGQEKVVRLLKRMVEVSIAREKPMDHILLVGPSGTGKTTFASVIAHELGSQVYQLEAPVSMDTLLEL